MSRGFHNNRLHAAADASLAENRFCVKRTAPPAECAEYTETQEERDDMESRTPSEKRTVLASTAICVQKFTIVLAVAIAAVAAAALSAVLRSTLYLLQKQNFILEYKRVGSLGLFEVFDSVSTASSFNHTSTENEDEVHLNLVFVMDLWERMVNIQSGLRRLVNVGVESGFTVVEPFMFESRIQPIYSDPYHFTAKNMTPKPAIRYFQTEDLFLTNSYISYEEGIKRLEQDNGSDKEAAKAYIIHAAVYFDWPDQAGAEIQEVTHQPTPFKWCDDKLHTMVSSNLGYMLSPTTFIERAVCVSLKFTLSPSVVTPEYFQSLFEFVRNGTNNKSRTCSKCVALAFMNYRKHAFNGFQSNLGTLPFKQKVPPLEVSTFGKDLGKRVRKQVLWKRPHVAIQMRTGKAFTLFEKYENKRLKGGFNITRYSSFKIWLQSCTRKVATAAKTEGRQLHGEVVYYIASDMLNEGWKGGEKCPEQIEKALNEARRYLSKELRPSYSFDPTIFGVDQDIMGTSSIADAAVCREADRFLYAKPSNFGQWVAEQRELTGKGAVGRIDCTDERILEE